MAATLSGKPIPILSRGYSMNKNVRKTNIIVATVISEILKTMLGPKGMSKMLVTDTGDVLITANGKAMLERLNVSHPIARVLIEVAKTQDKNCGDGTKTAVILAGELLKESGKLLDQGIHPAFIIKGYIEAVDKAMKILDKLAISISADNEVALKKVAKTVIGGYLGENEQNHVADLIVTAVKWIAAESTEHASMDIDNVGFVRKIGGGVNDSKLIRGVIINRGKPHPEMPEKITDAKIALLECSLNPFMRKSGDWSKEYIIKEKEQLTAFIKKENELNNEVVERIKRTGAKVLFCRKRISESLINCFAKKGILAFELVSEKDMTRLARATEGKIVSCVSDLTESNLGVSDLVEFQKIAGDEMLFVERYKNPKAATLLLRGGTTHTIEELERAVKNGIKAVALVAKNGKILPGGGATEMEISKELRKISRTFKGKEQLAVEAFATAIEAIPKTIASSAGLNPHDSLMELRVGHTNGSMYLGVNAVKRRIEDVTKDGLFDVFDAKRHAIRIAVEIATMILRIDDAVFVTNLEEIMEREKSKIKERKRVSDEKIRRLLEKDEELRKIGKRLTLPKSS